MLTYQDFEKAVNGNDLLDFIGQAITQHIASEEYKTALIADEYDHQRDVTVSNYTKFIAEHSGSDLVNATAANNRISSNFFHRLNTQRATYSLGNGIDFTNDKIKARLGSRFDKDFYKLAYKALIHRECFGFWNKDKLYVFPITEFVPIYDEYNGVLRAGIRFWRLAENKPTTAVLYEESGYTEFTSDNKAVGYEFKLTTPKKPYLTKGIVTKADGYVVVSEENYSSLPIKRMKGSDLYQSTLVGLRERIDSYDLIQSGFANDLQDCAQIYWIIENCGGMSETDLQTFLNKLNRDHIATADTKGMGVESASLKPYVQEVPFESRVAYLRHIRSAMYEDFGALDVTNMAASARTATEIESAYQPMDENADDFEYQCIDFIEQILELMGITGDEATPIFKRNRIANQYEQTQMIMLAAPSLDEETVLDKLPWISVDEVADIMKRRAIENPAEEVTNERTDSEDGTV